MSDFYKRLDEAEQRNRINRLFANRPDNLHDYQGCANDPSMVRESAPPQPVAAGKAFGPSCLARQHGCASECPFPNCPPGCEERLKPQPVAVQEGEYLKIEDSGWKPFPRKPSPAATTQPDPKPAPQVEGFEEWWNAYLDDPTFIRTSHAQHCKAAWSAAQAPLLQKIAELESAQPKKDEVFDLLWQDFIDEAEVEPSPEEEGFARWGWNMASGDYGHGFIDGREAGYHTCGSCGHPWEAHDGECSAHVKDGSICGCPRVISAQPKAEPVEQLVSDITLDVIAAKYPKEDAAHQMAVELQQYRQREERSGE